jgi:hypothetical protein
MERIFAENALTKSSTVLAQDLHDLMAVVNRFQVGRRRMEKRLQIVFIPAGSDRGDDLIEIEVDRTLSGSCGGGSVS